MTTDHHFGHDDEVQRGLRALGRLDIRDEAFERALRDRLLRRAHDITSTAAERSAPMPATIITTANAKPAFWGHGLRARLISVAAAILLVLGGDIALNLTVVRRPTPVSAQTVLRHAAAALHPADPDQVAHVTSTFYYGGNSSFGTGHQTLGTGPITFTVDQLTQYTATGAISRQVASGTSITGTLLFRMVQMGQAARIYGPRADIVEEFPMPSNTGFSWADNPFGVASPQQLVLAARQGALPNVRLLPPQQLGGSTVYVVESSYGDPVPPGADAAAAQPTRHVFRLYIDAQTYAIQGMDSLQADAGAALHVVERLRVTRRETVALSSLPADTFALNAPASARVVPASYDLSSVAQAVARPDAPAPLLSGDAQGLRLQYVMVARAPQPAALTYYYQSGLSFPGASSNKVFTVSIMPKTATPAREQQDVTAGSVISLTVAGAPVRATYSGPAQDGPGTERSLERSLTYEQGATTVQLAGVGLNKDAFFAVVRALVDGHTHPDVVTALQRELDTP